MVNNAQKTDTFFVKAVNKNCESNWFMIPFEVNKYPTKLTVKNDSICAGATANLQAFTDYGDLYWYDLKTGGSLMYTGNVLQTGKLSKDTQFYMVANNKGCLYAGGSKLVKAFVGSSFAPTSPNVPADTFVCARGVNSVTLTASSNSGSDTLRWFLDATGGTPVALGSSYTFKGGKRAGQTAKLSFKFENGVINIFVPSSPGVSATWFKPASSEIPSIVSQITTQLGDESGKAFLANLVKGKYDGKIVQTAAEMFRSVAKNPDQELSL